MLKKIIDFKCNTLRGGEENQNKGKINNSVTCIHPWKNLYGFKDTEEEIIITNTAMDNLVFMTPFLRKMVALNG